MKQVTLSIKEGKFSFFMELIKSFDFVQINDEGDPKEVFLKNISKGLKEVQKSKTDKLKTTPAKDFLNEL